MAKVKNIIKGNLSKYDIEEITIFENDIALYSGDINKFNNMNKADIHLYSEKIRIDNSNVEKCIKFNNKKLFIFI
jgi:hypothetical protein